MLRSQLVVTFLVLLASRAAAIEDGWRHVFQSNPAGFESRVLRSLDGALSRLQQHSAWPWQRRSRDRTLPEIDPDGWRRNGDALRLLLQVWRHRDDPIFLPSAVEALSRLAVDERAVSELEAYLPQLAYMILYLPVDSLLVSVLERFALRVCESNAHWALQLSWAVYGVLEDHRPELGDGNAEGYSRAARLLQLVEQSIVYGAKLVNRDTLRASALAHNVELWRHSLYSRVRTSLHAEGSSEESADATLPTPSLVAATLESGEGATGLRAPMPATPSAVEPSDALPTLQGELLKRKRRDQFGWWRCCGEAWTRRWFVLRGSVLFYYRRRGDTRPRGAMPMGQCRIELRPSPRGDYIKLTARFSTRTMRIRADPRSTEGPQLTHTWLRALRAAAGVTSPTDPPKPPPAAASVTAESLVAATPSTPATLATPSTPSTLATPTGEESAAAGARSRHVLPPVDILLEADTLMDHGGLSMSQRCVWLYLRAVRQFVRSLAMVSEALYTPGASGASGASCQEGGERCQGRCQGRW